MGASTETALPADDPEVGAVIDGRYRLIERVGLGGMGAVYRAEHVGMGRVVAVKLLRPELGGRTEAIERFTREAQASARVAHKNVVAVSDFGVRDDGTLYLVMEYLRGETLRERLDRAGRLPWPHALTIARHVARGLAHAHAEGVIHRDIKPENVFLVEDDDDHDYAKILDFGIARSLESDDGRVTQAGFVVGTPAYLSPEQALGGDIDHRCDLYSLCTVLFEMICGRTPFGDRPPVAMLTAHAVVDVPSFAEVAPDVEVPVGLEAVVRRGLAKDREERFADAAALTAALDELRGRMSTEMPAMRPSTGMPAVPGGYTPFPGGYATPVPGGYATPMPARPVNLGAPPPVAAEGIRAWVLSMAPWLRDPVVVKRRLKWAIGGSLLLGVLVAIMTSANPGSAPGGGATAPGAASGAPAAADLLDLPPLPAALGGATDDEKLKAALLDLDKGKTCEERKAAVARLRELDDARAVPALKRARYRMRGGVLGLGDANTNACLRADAEAAIAALGRVR